MNGLRPKDLALFLLASGDLLPRKRARDQQADIAGLELKRRVLDMLVAIDPEPEQLELALLQIAQAIGPPDGPTRAICATVRDDWQAAAATWLIAQALREGESPSGRRGGRRAGRDMPQDTSSTNGSRIQE
jgi:hypothetical protein